jgi:hypothetical protein
MAASCRQKGGSEFGQTTIDKGSTVMVMADVYGLPIGLDDFARSIVHGWHQPDRRTR